MDISPIGFRGAIVKLSNSGLRVPDSANHHLIQKLVKRWSEGVTEVVWVTRVYWNHAQNDAEF